MQIPIPQERINIAREKWNTDVELQNKYKLDFNTLYPHKKNKVEEHEEHEEHEEFEEFEESDENAKENDEVTVVDEDLSMKIMERALKKKLEQAQLKLTESQLLKSKIKAELHKINLINEETKKCNEDCKNLLSLC